MYANCFRAAPAYVLLMTREPSRDTLGASRISFFLAVAGPNDDCTLGNPPNLFGSGDNCQRGPAGSCDEFSKFAERSAATRRRVGFDTFLIGEGLFRRRRPGNFAAMIDAGRGLEERG